LASAAAARPLIEEVDLNAPSTSLSSSTNNTTTTSGGGGGGMKSGFLASQPPSKKTSSSSSSSLSSSKSTKDIVLPKTVHNEPLVTLVSSVSTLPPPTRPIYTLSCSAGIVTVVLQLPLIVMTATTRCCCCCRVRLLFRLLNMLPFSSL
jgi:hypothetical protein